MGTEISTDELIQPLFDALSQCPHCHSSYLKRLGKSGSIQRYRCKCCLKTFNNKTNTPIANLRKRYLWKEYARCMVLKLTLRGATDICHINLRTALLWQHRFLTAQVGKNHDKLSGIIKVDEFLLTQKKAQTPL